MTNLKTVRFTDLRGDWYRGADLMARLVARSTNETIAFLGFPISWIPMFVHWGAQWSDPTPPTDYLPIFSELDACQIEKIVKSAREKGQLRPLVEAAASLDPLLADVLHKLDRRKDGAAVTEARLPLTGWQSYGRPEVLTFNERALAAGIVAHQTATLLPCARRRPYHESKTHKRLSKGLRGLGIAPDQTDLIVISSLGVIPQALWDDAVTLAYDSGVPDVYRILRLMRAYFSRNRYKFVIDCLEFEPYRDCVRILRDQGLFEVIIDGPKRRIKTLPRP